MVQSKIKTFDYQELVSRNAGYLDSDSQKELAKLRIVFAGCGLSSRIALDAVRLGVTQFIFYDFDKVELSNLNRQHFFLQDIGKFKSKTLIKKIMNINPQSSVTAYRKKIMTQKDILKLLSEGDIIINTLDFGSVYFDLVSEGIRMNKLVLCPLNVGFGGILVCFNHNSVSMYEMMKVTQPLTGIEFYKKLLSMDGVPTFPHYITKNLDAIFGFIKINRYDPQLIIGANIISSLVLSCIVKYVKKEKIPLAPSIIHRDFYEI